MPQDQNDIKGADAMKQAPTPGPLSGDQVVTWYSQPVDIVTITNGDGRVIFKIKADGSVEGEETDEAALIFARKVSEFLQSMGLAPTAPVEASGSERDAFEKWYCDDAATVGIKMLPIEILALREGETYGPKRVALNSKWEAWQARAALDRG